MATNKDGELTPLMLSDLIKLAQAALNEHGDMPVGVYTCEPGFEFNEEHEQPVSDTPTVTHPKWLSAYWAGRFTKAFTIDGA